MIVPMKKVTLIISDEQKTQTLNQIRKLGMIHIEITEGHGQRLADINEQIALLESLVYIMGKSKKVEQKQADIDKVLSVASKISELTNEKKNCLSEKAGLVSELNRLKSWGEVDPDQINSLSQKGVDVLLYEMPKAEYKALGDNIQTVRVGNTGSQVRFLLVRTGGQEEEKNLPLIDKYRLVMPYASTEKLRNQAERIDTRISEIDSEIKACAVYSQSIKKAIELLRKEAEFEIYASGMQEENLNGEQSQYSISYFHGFIEADNLEKLKKEAKDNFWGLIIDEPSEEDNVPTKLKNNKLVSLIYPLTDFLGTVPGYFEYDISGWFLAFILLFFGIIFGDGGYGLFIIALVSVPIIKSLIEKKPVSPTFLLIGLFGLSTVIWGTLTCTWFGLSPEQLPSWLKNLSVPLISNVNEDTIWSLPWTSEGVGLTTAQNLQIFCFTLALVQLSVAHIKCAVRNRRSLKILGDIGSVLQLLGIYYLVLSFVVNAEVFTFDLEIYGVPIGMVAIACIGLGFLLSFVFSNYDGSIIKSVLSSVKNIVSVLLGVVNVFSDIVSYIRLWAVGLAGAAIATTVNELASPLLGNFMFMIIAIVLLVFGHGLNMILNILSVIVHGIRLNTLEFSSHLDMSWSGRKFTPFKE